MISNHIREQPTQGYILFMKRCFQCSMCTTLFSSFTWHPSWLLDGVMRKLRLRGNQGHTHDDLSLTIHSYESVSLLLLHV